MRDENVEVIHGEDGKLENKHDLRRCGCQVSEMSECSEWEL